MVAGDFNAKSAEWFACCTDRKGALLSEFAIANRLVLMNDSADPTRFHQGYKSHIDVTFVSESLACQIKGWAVLEGESGSGHNYICFIVERRAMVAAPKKVGKWAINKLDRPVRSGDHS